jgi:hypothetical protein
VTTVVIFLAAVAALVVALVCLGAPSPPPICFDATAFVDGELSRRRARRFREHLRTCEVCRDWVIAGHQLSAHLSSLPPKGPPT